MSNHVFVVDDDEALGRLSRIILQVEGLEVEAFTSSVEALEKLADSSYPNPAAIVLDLNMPDLNGRDFYRQAREVGYTGPVLIASAYGAKAAQRELGAEAALDKPFQPEALAETVKGLLYTLP
jgi:DNA-binding response OmpR family regulator